MSTLLWIAIAYLAGSLPLSVWLGRVALKRDIRQYGDHNPGSANVFRAGGKFWGTLAMALDFLKGAIPVGLANYVFGLEGWAMAAVAIAPVLGHAYSPFLGFRGGKALAVTFGIWAGLTLWRAPIFLGIMFAAWLTLLTVEGWAVLLGMASLLVALLISDANTTLLATWLGNTLILAWKHRADLSQMPRIRFLGRDGA